MMRYHLIRLSEESISKKTLKTKYGSYESTVLPFDLIFAPGFFTSAMNKIFASLIDRNMIICLNDILTYGQTWSEHLAHIRNVLGRDSGYRKFHGKLKKCVFGVEEIEHLGFKLYNNKLLVDPTRLKTVQAWGDPVCKGDVQSFLGMINLCR